MLAARKAKPSRSAMKLTPVERRMMAALRTGRAARDALRACLADELGSPSNVRFHVSRLRQKLAGRGRSIECFREGRQVFYRIVRV